MWTPAIQTFRTFAFDTQIAEFPAFQHNKATLEIQESELRPHPGDKCGFEDVTIIM